jgi:hypothetical protein
MTGPPSCPFGAPWEDLKLRDLRAFLRGNPPERASWEAKQQTDKGQLAKFVRRECCAFANRNGGYLLLGAEDRKGSGWTLSGIEVPGVKELHDWIASLLRELSPPPGFDVHEWGLSNGRHVVIVQIEPAAVPPVSFNGTVYIRHGTQTVRADGPAITRLANTGARTQRGVEATTRREAKRIAEQVFATFALAIGRPGDRPQALSDTEPRRVADLQLREALKKRWRIRALDELTWGHREPRNQGEIVLDAAPDLGYSGWRVGLLMTEVAQDRRARQIMKRRRQGSRRSWGRNLPRHGDQDIWMVHLATDAVATGSHWQLPVALTNSDKGYGRRALGQAEVVLRALVATELALGANPDEPAFVCLALSNPGPGNAAVLVEMWDRLSVSPRAWHQAATSEAEKKMHLDLVS